MSQASALENGGHFDIRRTPNVSNPMLQTVDTASADSDVVRRSQAESVDEPEEFILHTVATKGSVEGAVLSIVEYQMNLRGWKADALGFQNVKDLATYVLGIVGNELASRASDHRIFECKHDTPTFARTVMHCVDVLHEQYVRAEEHIRQQMGEVALDVCDATGDTRPLHIRDVLAVVRHNQLTRQEVDANAAFSEAVSQVIRHVQSHHRLPLTEIAGRAS